MSVAHVQPEPEMTEHALLVLYGRFAEQVGLIDALKRVPFAMKTVDHSPGEKLSQLLVHILAGGMHIKEMDSSPHPLVPDVAVAAAWAQEHFASASGVSDLLRAASPEVVGLLKAEIEQVLEPYRRRILREAVTCQIVVDFDLAGLLVSDQATTYEGAEYGYIGEAKGLALGYQFALAQLAGVRDTLLLGGFLHSGKTVSLHCLTELVGLVEAQLGRPRRRVELLEARVAAAEREFAELEARVVNESASRRPRQQRLESLGEALARKWEVIERLRARRDEMAAENAANPLPRRILLRMDGGFGAGARLGWLYEQGYDFVTRGHSHSTADSLRNEVGLVWQKVGKNEQVAESQRTTLGECPYPMRLFVCRQQRSEGERWTTLIVNPELTAKEWPVRRLAVFYNARQGIEAAIKEGKGIFASRHLPTRKQAGIALYQELVLLAQSLVRWFRRQYLGRSELATASVKELVRIGANSRAEVMRSGRAVGIRFSADSPWHGITLWSKLQLGYQLWFPFLEDYRLAQARP